MSPSPFPPSRVVLCSLALVGACGVGACGGGAPGGDAPSGPPDILLVSLDTVRADRLSCYGNDAPTTPFLDRMAALGVRFEEVLSSAPHTAPSHMSLFTGLDPSAHGISNRSSRRSRVPALNAQVPTLPELLGEAGYHTLIVSDGGQLLPDMGFGRGFDQSFYRYSKFDEKLDALADLLDGVPADGAPLFAFFHSYECHAPYLPPVPVAKRFVDMTYDGPFKRRWDRLRRTEGGYLQLVGGGFLDEYEGMGADDVEWLKTLYDATLAYADGRVAELWRRWGEVRDAERTVLAVVSDHGEAFYEHGYLGHPGRLDRELVRVPLIVRGPGIGVGVVGEPVPLAGLFASLLELGGAPVPGHAEPGFTAALRDPATPPAPRELHQQTGGSADLGRSDAVAAGGRRLIEVAGEPAGAFAFPSDPLEQAPLALDGATLARLREAIETRRGAARALRQRFPEALLDNPGVDNAAELEALGYIDGDGEVGGAGDGDDPSGDGR